jgi:hypothetical protein
LHLLKKPRLLLKKPRFLLKKPRFLLKKPQKPPLPEDPRERKQERPDSLVNKGFPVFFYTLCHKSLYHLNGKGQI